MTGSHCLKTYSVTQKFVTLSSGDAELMALVKATTEAIGLCQLAAGWGDSLQASVYVDSSAALAVTARKGNGRLRHVRIGHLWVQELAERDEVGFHKVRGGVNPADLCTKHVSPSKASELIALTSQLPKLGEADARLRLRSLGACFPAHFCTRIDQTKNGLRLDLPQRAAAYSTARSLARTTHDLPPRGFPVDPRAEGECSVQHALSTRTSMCA